MAEQRARRDGWQATLQGEISAGFIIMLGSAGILGVFGATLPFIMVVLLYALELLVAFLQAYVFAILTCIYLNDAFHPGH